MIENLITITTEDLRKGGDIMPCGIFERVRQRVAHSNAKNKKLGIPLLAPKEERSILIGEIGELAVRKDLLNRGYHIDMDSWTEFSNFKGRESTVDILARREMQSIRYQVKASEAGNRTIKFDMLRSYIMTRIDILAFVAIREIFPGDNASYFEATITSQMHPTHIPRLATWEKKHDGYAHKDNNKFIEDWCVKTRIQNRDLKNSLDKVAASALIE